MTAESSLPPHILALLQRYFHAIEALDAWRLLRRVRPGARTAQALASELCLSETVVVEVLQQLVTGNLVVQIGSESPLHYRYQEPSDAKTLDELDALDALSDSQRLELLLAISSQAIGRVRSGARRAFLPWNSKKRD